jgi:aspartyl-tRNA synthetase
MQYDLVCNGFEVGGGSIRAHKPDILKAVFEIIGQTPDKIEEQFGHMLRAFTLGTPPHGGIALGVERLIMILTGEKYLREVQAFPQSTSGTTSVMDAPAAVDQAQLEELGIKLTKSSADE